MEVDRARRVAGVVFFRKGHMALDWRRTASMTPVVRYTRTLRLPVALKPSENEALDAKKSILIDL